MDGADWRGGICGVLAGQEGACGMDLARMLISGHEFAVISTADPDLPTLKVLHQFAIVLVIQRTSPNYP